MSNEAFQILLATLSLAGGIIGASAKAIWDRRADKKKPKTDNRAKAYEDFIAQVLDDPDHNKDAFHEVWARLLVYGETNVLEALTKYYECEKSSLINLMPVITEMRRSLLTRHKSKAQQAINSLLEYELKRPNWVRGNSRPECCMDSATILWGLLFGSIGLSYFMYGKKQSHVVARYTCVALMIYPYFISNTIILVFAGILLLLLPKFLKL